MAQPSENEWVLLFESLLPLCLRRQRPNLRCGQIKSWASMKRLGGEQDPHAQTQCIWVSCPAAVTKGSLQLMFPGHSASLQGMKAAGMSVAQSHHIHGDAPKSNRLVNTCSPCFLLFVQSRAHEMEPPMFRVGLPTSVNTIESLTGVPAGQPNLDDVSVRTLSRCFYVVSS